MCTGNRRKATLLVALTLAIWLVTILDHVSIPVELCHGWLVQP